MRFAELSNKLLCLSMAQLGNKGYKRSHWSRIDLVGYPLVVGSWSKNLLFSLQRL